ncbi:MAG TPA: ATPase, T2SS/T4P/T4SS family [Ktedonobacteraceae bacterium]|nr:ATPase, T2SS/T4P/T4SS family [Ktedonobacteraceae bacterium]
MVLEQPNYGNGLAARSLRPRMGTRRVMRTMRHQRLPSLAEIERPERQIRERLADELTRPLKLMPELMEDLVPVQTSAEDDSWLNDTLPQSRKKPDFPRNVLSEKSLEKRGEQATYGAKRPQKKPVSMPETVEHILPGHRLWPTVLRLSERIWKELPDSSIPGCDAPTPELVRSRCLDILRAEPLLAGHIADLYEAERVIGAVINETLGYGPLTVFMQDERVSEIMAVGARLLHIERDGDMQEVRPLFEDEAHLTRIVKNILRMAGCPMHGPIADVKLPDGSFANIVLPPGTVKGPTITIRKRRKATRELSDLVATGMLSQEMAEFLRASVQGRLNIVICGGIRSGRTTLLNALANCIPDDERIVTIEDVAELQLRQKQVIALEAFQNEGGPSQEQETVQRLIAHALRMRPQRIVVDECRGNETVDLLQSILTGYDGSLLTMYSNSATDCLDRLEMLWLVSELKLPISIIRTQLAHAIDLMVYVARLDGGSRKVMNIAEVQGFEGDTLKLQSIFSYEELDGEGTFEVAGFRPICLGKLQTRGIHLLDELFYHKEDEQD